MKGRVESPSSHETEDGLRKQREFADTFELGEFFESVHRAFEHHLNCERAYRRGKRAKALRKTGIKRTEDEKEKKHHENSMAEIDNALKELNDGRKRLGRERLREMDDLVKDPTKFKEYRKATQKVAFEKLLNQEIDPVITEEIVVIFEDILDNVAHKKGASGLLDSIEENLKKLKTLRSEGKNRGRDEHCSPLVHPKVIWLTICFGFWAAGLIWCWITGQDVQRCAIDSGIFIGGWYLATFLQLGC